MKLIPNWKEAHKFLTVRLSALGAVASTVWGNVLTDQQKTDFLGLFGISKPSTIVAILFVTVVAVRFLKQKDKHDDYSDTRPEAHE